MSHQLRRYFSSEITNEISVDHHKDVSVVRPHDALLENCKNNDGRTMEERRSINTSPPSLKPVSNETLNNVSLVRH